MHAVLWDMDGLLIDSEPLWTVAESELATRLGGVFTADLKAAMVGTRLEHAVPVLLSGLGVEPTARAIEQAASWLLERVAQLFRGDLPLRPGAAELLRELDEASVPQALVSSSYRVLVDAVLAGGIGPFVTTVAGDEVEHGKPHPEPYLVAAARLGVDPTRCVVLEDAPAGVTSGTAAGCAVVAVPSVPGVAFAPAPRRLVVASLADLKAEDLSRLLAVAA